MSASAGAVRFELFDESQQSDVAMTWLAKQLNREPDAADLYNVSRAVEYLVTVWRARNRLGRLGEAVEELITC